MGNCEPPYMGAGNQNQVLLKGSKDSSISQALIF